jgi:quinol monooxygenase YgiN
MKGSMHRLQFLLLALLLAVVTPIVGAQAPAPQATPGDAPFYSVAYVDVMPAAHEKMVAMMRSYRDASRKESGYVRFDLLQQVGWPGHMAVIETWRDKSAFDAHAMAASVRQFKDAVQAIRVSGYDERPYRALVAATPAAPPDSTGQALLYLVAHVDIGPGGQADAPAMLKTLAESSRMESGAVLFEVLQHAMRPNHFTVVGAWRTQQAVDAHAAAAHTKKYRETLQPVSGSPLDERLYKAVP